jgi:uncharacterized protein GlcG (DUF336 family)
MIRHRKKGGFVSKSMREWFGSQARLGRALASPVVAWMVLAGSTGTVAQSQAVAQLSPADVTAVIRAAAESIGDAGLAIAVVDRRGIILGVYARPGAAGTTPDTAVITARTAALFSNNQAPLSSRTIRFISGRHFPPGVDNTPGGPLYGVENINRGCNLTENDNEPYARPRSIVGSGLAGGPLACRPDNTSGCAFGPPIVGENGEVFTRTGVATGKTSTIDAGGPDEVAVNPGGFALYRSGQVVGAIGVAGAPPARAEYAAIVGAAGTNATTGLFAAPSNPLPEPGAVFIEGFRLPFFQTCTSVECVLEIVRQGPPGGQPGSFTSSDILVPSRAGEAVPEGYLIGPRASRNPSIPAAQRLSQADVQRVVDQAVARSNVTRAQVRLPLTQTARMIISVTDSTGDILALYRMPDALADAVDVVPSKARNAYYFSTREGYEELKGYITRGGKYTWEPEPPAGRGWAVTSRTIGFGGQPLFPPGIDRPEPLTPGEPKEAEQRGPWFGLYLFDLANPCTEGNGPSRGQNRAGFLFQNGITWFPGSAPLYRDGVPIGGVGVSGDGIEQNDYVTAGAVVGFEVPPELRVDRSVIRKQSGLTVRLPYWKFPRNPEIR